jgi:hypothetical protein
MKVKGKKAHMDEQVNGISLFTDQYFHCKVMAHFNNHTKMQKLMYYYCQTHRLNGLLQTKYLLLQQMQCARFTTMSCKRSCTGRVNAIHPVLQLNLTWCLNITVVSKEMNSLYWHMVNKGLQRHPFFSFKNNKHILQEKV